MLGMPTDNSEKVIVSKLFLSESAFLISFFSFRLEIRGKSLTRLFAVSLSSFWNRTKRRSCSRRALPRVSALSSRPKRPDWSSNWRAGLWNKAKTSLSCRSNNYYFFWRGSHDASNFLFDKFFFFSDFLPRNKDFPYRVESLRLISINFHLLGKRGLIMWLRWKPETVWVARWASIFSVIFYLLF